MFTARAHHFLRYTWSTQVRMAHNEVSGLVMSPLQSTLNHLYVCFPAFFKIYKYQPRPVFSSGQQILLLSIRKSKPQLPVSFIKEGSPLLFCWFSWLWLANKRRWSQNRCISKSLTSLDIDSDCMSMWCKMPLKEIKKSGNVSLKVDSQPIANF